MSLVTNGAWGRVAMLSARCISYALCSRSSQPNHGATPIVASRSALKITQVCMVQPSVASRANESLQLTKARNVMRSSKPSSRAPSQLNSGVYTDIQTSP